MSTGAYAFELSASAWDAAGNRGDSPVITAFTPMPVLSIYRPLAGTIVTDVVPVEIKVTRPELDVEAWLEVDGTSVGASGPPPLIVNWDTAAWSDGGPHRLQAVGRMGAVPVASAPVEVRVRPGPHPHLRGLPRRRARAGARCSALAALVGPLGGAGRGRGCSGCSPPSRSLLARGRRSAGAARGRGARRPRRPAAWARC